MIAMGMWAPWRPVHRSIGRWQQPRDKGPRRGGVCVRRGKGRAQWGVGEDTSHSQPRAGPHEVIRIHSTPSSSVTSSAAALPGLSPRQSTPSASNRLIIVLMVSFCCTVCAETGNRSQEIGHFPVNYT